METNYLQGSGGPKIIFCDFSPKLLKTIFAVIEKRVKNGFPPNTNGFNLKFVIRKGKQQIELKYINE